MNISKKSFAHFNFAIFFAGLSFLRLLFAEYPFSFDYPAYIFMIDNLSKLSFADITDKNLIFPYVLIQGIVPVELGFSLIAKTISLFEFSPEVTFAIIASASVGLRIYTMRALGVPVLWTIWINIFAITLLEANALRLGVASSMLLFGLYQIFRSRMILGYVAVFLSLTIHLQIVIFVIPFFLFHFIPRWSSQSKFNMTIVLAAACIATIIAFQFINIIENEKLQEYVERGASGSAGLTLTSLLAILLIIAIAAFIKNNESPYPDSKFFTTILAASVPSVLSLMLLTNVAVIGDRAWQLAFLVLSSFLFTRWTGKKSKMLLLSLVLILSLVMQINVLVRYPLSNFFSPPFPAINYLQ